MKKSLLFELAWILPSIAIPIGMLVAIVVAAFGMNIHVPTNTATVHAATLDQSPPFDSPGVTMVEPGYYRAVIIGQAWSFTPNEVRLPPGSKLEIIATSRDVIHGFRIEGTNVNVMLIPGRIAQVEARFDKPGEYLIVCHEYCGIGHHAMYGKVIVEE